MLRDGEQSTPDGDVRLNEHAHLACQRRDLELGYTTVAEERERLAALFHRKRRQPLLQQRLKGALLVMGLDPARLARACLIDRLILECCGCHIFRLPIRRSGDSRHCCSPA